MKTKLILLVAVAMQALMLAAASMQRDKAIQQTKQVLGIAEDWKRVAAKWEANATNSAAMCERSQELCERAVKLCKVLEQQRDEAKAAAAKPMSISDYSKQFEGTTTEGLLLAVAAVQLSGTEEEFAAYIHPWMVKQRDELIRKLQGAGKEQQL